MQVQVQLPKILWLEDHPSTVMLLKEEFDHYFDLEVVPGIQELTQKLYNESNLYNAILIDMELAEGKSGFDAYQIYKQSGSKASILILSNDETLKTRISMLSLGIDDYLWKAMDPEEMMIRIRNAIQRKSARPSTENFERSGLVLDPVKMIVMVNGVEVEFSRIEFHFLMQLLLNDPAPVFIETLRKEVWKLPVLENGTINTFIWKMNKKLNAWSLRLKKNGASVGLIEKKG